jgi:hypothetical protein
MIAGAALASASFILANQGHYLAINSVLSAKKHDLAQGTWALFYATLGTTHKERCHV